MRRAALIAARRAYVSPLDVRRQWRVLIEAAIDVAAGASGTPAINPRAAKRGSMAERLGDFAHLLREGAGVVFPADGMAAALMAEAFFKLARAVMTAEGDRRETCAPALGACALALGELLHADAVASAEPWQRRLRD